jgi:hypothetical protein
MTSNAHLLALPLPDLGYFPAPLDPTHRRPPMLYVFENNELFLSRNLTL